MNAPDRPPQGTGEIEPHQGRGTPWIRVLRTGLQLFPFGIGSAIDSAVFGTADDLRVKRLEAFMAALARDLKNLGDPRAKATLPVDMVRYFESEEFLYMFEGVFRRVSVEVAQAKLDALRGVLVSVIAHGVKVPFEKQSSFLKTVDLLEGTHIRVLRLLVARSGSSDEFLSHPEICRHLEAQSEADVNFVYHAIDTLANREFIMSGPIPFDPDGRLAKERQAFRATALGREFLDFLRMSEPASTT